MDRMLYSLLIAVAIALPAQSPAKPRAGTQRSSSTKQSAADAAYAKAREGFYALMGDAKRRKYRDQWMAVIDSFEEIARKYPKSPRAPESLYNVARLYSDMSRVSLARRDLHASMDAYRRLYERYPGSYLADDAHLELGSMYLERLGDIEAARRELSAAARSRGDMAGKAKKLLASLPPPPKAPAKPTPAAQPEKRIARAEPKTVESKQPKTAEPAPRAEPVAVKEKGTTAAEQKTAEAAPVESPASEAVKVFVALEKQAETAAAPAASPIPLAPHPDEGDVDEDEAAAENPLAESTTPRTSTEAGKQRLAALARAADTAVPLSVQVGLKVKRVIIDAGHGGHDTGAIGPNGVKEKDITLAIAKMLEKNLKKQGFEVLMTRTDDRFVALEERTRFANRRRGDLFVSIHCNAHPSRKMRGIETYTLNVTSDKYAIRLAARENASSEKTLSDLQFILADLATKANTTDSQRLARAVQSSLVASHARDKNKPRDLGVKQALFYVLLGARMPAILVETAFLSNPIDEKRLNTAEYQQRLADAIGRGIARFVGERNELAHALTE